jgi:hypothetical protein
MDLILKPSEEGGHLSASGILSAYAWPGGYPIYYLDANFCVLCPACATDSLDDQWLDHQPRYLDINWEDAHLYCEQCENRIESAYAEED